MHLGGLLMKVSKSETFCGCYPLYLNLWNQRFPMGPFSSGLEAYTHSPSKLKFSPDLRPAKRKLEWNSQNIPHWVSMESSD